MHKLEKWREWIESISADCSNVMLSADMFRDLHLMIQKNPKMQQADYFHEYMRDTYIAHVTMMIRKHAKTDQNSISLSVLAKDILESAESYGAPVPDNFDRMRDQFVRRARKVEAFADRKVAHCDKRPPAHIPTYAEVDEAIEAMDQLTVACAYVAGICMTTCKATVQYGWLNVFRDMGIET